MPVDPHPHSGIAGPQFPSGGPVADPSRRSRLRWATVGGVAAIAVLGGGITAAASAGAPAGGSVVAASESTAAPSYVTSRLVPSGLAAPGAPGTDVAAPPAAGGTGTAAPSAPLAPKAHRPHLDGTVTSVRGATVLILDHEGFTRTVVESGRTTYHDGLTAALAVGTKIHAEGTVAANGTSLDATVIGADNGPPAGPAGRGPGGPGGPGRPGDKHAGLPNGAATPPAPGGTTAAPTPPAGTTAPSTSAPATTK